MSHMQAFGHGGRREISAQQAMDIAKQATPRSIPAEHRKDRQVGHMMQIAPADYLQTQTTGRLVGVTPAAWILAREEDEVGTVHLHFPKAGFTLKAANS